MIVLLTTPREAMYVQDGLRDALVALKHDAWRLARDIAHDTGRPVLWVTANQDDGIDLTDDRISVMRATQSPEVLGPSEAGEESIVPARRGSVAAAQRVGGGIEEWCQSHKRIEPIVMISDADSCFYPAGLPGAFTTFLHGNRQLIRHISVLGKVIAEEYNAHLLILAAISQYPEPMAEFVDKYEWCWVGHREGRFEHRSGSLPEELQRDCPPMERPETVIKWTKVMSMQELAKRFGVHRNTMRELLKKIRHREVPGGIQIDVNELPKT